MASRMRADDRAEVVAGGAVPRHLVFELWRGSHESYAGLIDGDLAAMFGCAGPLLAPSGHVWLLTTPTIELMPIAFAKEARAFLRRILEIKTEVYSGCVEGYERSLRLWRMLGFQVREPTVVPQTGARFHMLVMER